MISIAASGVSNTRSMSTTRPSVAMDATAAKPSMNVVSCTRPGNTAGPSSIAGGMNMNTAGALNAIGTNTTTTATNFLPGARADAGPIYGLAWVSAGSLAVTLRQLWYSRIVGIL